MKKVKSATAAKPVTPPGHDSALRILKTGTCPSLSGKSKLTYQIGREGSSDLQFRITANSSTGFFNDDWVSLSEIQELLGKVPSNKPITSFALVPLYRGKSMNTPGFLFAALIQEGLMQASKEKKRCYERLDPKGFAASVKTLSGLPGVPRQEPPSEEAKSPKTEGNPQKAADKPKQAAPRTPPSSSKKATTNPKTKKKA